MSDWTPWRDANPELRFTEDSLAETLDGGQAFRWVRQETDDGLGWEGCMGDCVIQVRLSWESDGEQRPLQWRHIGKQAEAAEGSFARYFALDTGFEELTDRLPWRGDHPLRSRIERLPGLRILRQPIDEALLCFLCSSTKQIPQIREMTHLLAREFGEPLPGGWNRLPGWERLAEVPEAALRACRLGYRARYIAETARFLKEHPGWLAETERTPYPEAHRRLLKLPGVGAKIADCVLLFGAGRLEAFPVDTWILKAMTRIYGLEGWRPAQIAHFGSVHFAPAPGLAQQYLFSGERRRADLHLSN